MCVYAGKGRTNVELREQFYLAEGVSQSGPRCCHRDCVGLMCVYAGKGRTNV